jgi:hypothetical protein
MHKNAREIYNAAFSDALYQNMQATIERDFPGELDFRIAESPVFVPIALKDKLIEACESFIDVIAADDFKAKTERAIPAGQRVPNENEHTSFLAIDFAVCKDREGSLTPQLIELQGFPSIMAYQGYLSELFKLHFPIPESFTYAFGMRSYEDYIEALRKLIVGNENPENVILLEIYPEQQKTRIDFAVTERMLGVKAVGYTDLIKEGRVLYYEKEGRKIQIKRIYNRLIFDDLTNFPDLKSQYKFTDDVEVTWVGHPNWFFRISKFTLPLLHSPYVPETSYLSDFQGNYPNDLENYVLKPLFSFAGTGVQLHVTSADLEKIPDPANYILQRKVQYEPVIQSPEALIKCEIRMLYIWPDKASRPHLLTSLSRLSRGEMVGVRFNKDFTWVGGSACFYEN